MRASKVVDLTMVSPRPSEPGARAENRAGLHGSACTILPGADTVNSDHSSVLGALLDEALADPRPSVSLGEAFEGVFALYREDMKRLGRDP